MSQMFGAATAAQQPQHGFTRHGRPVHGRTLDHLPSHSAVARFNKRLGVAVTGAVGTMWCAYAFAVLALLSLPAVVSAAFGVHWFPKWLVAIGLISLVAWIAQTFLQLVLLSIIIVGQNAAAEAADARAAKTFEDGEWNRDALDLATPGGLRDVLDELHELHRRLAGSTRTRAADEQVVTLRAGHQVDMRPRTAPHLVDPRTRFIDTTEPSNRLQ